MNVQARELYAKIRNLFQAGEFRRRYDDGRIQVQTHNNRVVEKAEAFPYGFIAKAKNGRAFVICQGGDIGGFEILPLLPGDGVTPPELGEGDVALYTGGGGRIVLLDAGGIEIVANGGEGKIHVANDATNLCGVLVGIIDEIKGLVTTGSPTSQTVMPATREKLEAYKTKIESLLKEEA